MSSLVNTKLEAQRNRPIPDYIGYKGISKCVLYGCWSAGVGIIIGGAAYSSAIHHLFKKPY